MRLRHYIGAYLVMAVSVMALPLCLYSHENQWEQIENIGEDVKPVSHQNDIEVFSASSVIRVNVTKPVKIEIFTILGKLVSSEHLTAGYYEFRMNSHGVYIVKTEGSTSKVAI